MIENVAAYFSKKWGQSSKSFVYMEADFPYMEMHENFNLLFLKNYIFETI